MRVLSHTVYIQFTVYMLFCNSTGEIHSHMPLQANTPAMRVLNQYSCTWDVSVKPSSFLHVVLLVVHGRTVVSVMESA